MKLELLNEIWKNKRFILIALKNRLFSPKSIKRMAQTRLAICATCPFASMNAQTLPYGNLPWDHCTACGCMLGLKTYSPESKCPKGKW